MYRVPSHLFFDEFLLESASGVQQGDPLGPLLFCLVTRDLNMAMKSPLNTWFLDDGTVGGEVQMALQDMQTVKQRGAAIGLELNLEKCEAYIYGGTETSRAAATATMLAFAPTIRLLRPDILTLLGAPLLPEGIAKAMEEKTGSLKLLTSRLENLPAHQALFILKNCLGAPKVLYLLRSAPGYLRRDKLADFDKLVCLSISTITNINMTDPVWRQASLPVSRSGLGIRRTEELALPAYLASVHSVRGLVSQIVPSCDLDELVVEPMSLWCDSTGKTTPSLLIKRQEQWDLPAVDKALDLLRSEATERDKVRLMALSASESGSWLHALPVPGLGTLLDDDCLRIAVALRLGADMCLEHQCRCRAVVHASGHHGLSCVKNIGRYSRHTALNDLVKRALVSASIPAILEPPGLDRRSNTRPDGKTLSPWKQGKPLAWDVTCVDTMANSNILGSSQVVGHAATEAERLKTIKYQNITDHFIFSPVGFETMGPWGPSAKELISLIGRRITDRTGEKQATEFLRQRISIAIQRGNAASISDTVSHSKGLDELFMLLV